MVSTRYASVYILIELSTMSNKRLGEVLASAGDDGNILLWVPAENPTHTTAFGEDGLEDKETWRVKHMCRSMGSEIYDLAWSPDGVFFITGSMDNIARIYNAQTGTTLWSESLLGQMLNND
jgi:WD40 repeat protein